jgi:hypothetical protein
VLRNPSDRSPSWIFSQGGRQECGISGHHPRTITSIRSIVEEKVASKSIQTNGGSYFRPIHSSSSFDPTPANMWIYWNHANLWTHHLNHKEFALCPFPIVGEHFPATSSATSSNPSVFPPSELATILDCHGLSPTDPNECPHVRSLIERTHNSVMAAAHNRLSTRKNQEMEYVHDQNPRGKAINP